mgnify:CR=1 FL=1
MGKQQMSMDFQSHEVQTIYPPITPYLYKKLEKKYVDYLWKIIKKGKKQKEEYIKTKFSHYRFSIILVLSLIKIRFTVDTLGL